MAQRKFIIDGGFKTDDASELLANLTMGGSILPDVDSDGTTGYDLGSTTAKWKDLYLSQGSLYINNQKVIHDDSGTIVLKADTDQGLTVKTEGTGVITLQSTQTVNVAGTLQMLDGKNITSSGGTSVGFGDKIDMNSNKIINVPNPTDGGDVSNKTYVDLQISNVVNGAPGALDTLNELANALGDDANFSTTITNNIAANASAITALQTTSSNNGTAMTTAQADIIANTTAISSEATTARAAEATLTTNLAAETTARVAFETSATADIGLKAAKTYVDSQDAALTSTLQSYADTAEADAVTSANLYTDGRETAITTAYTSAISVLTTDDVPESGSPTNVYFTDARVDTALGTVGADILPATTETYNLGSATNRWNKLFLKGSTIDLGGVDISASGGGMSVGGSDMATQAYADQAEADAITTAVANIKGNALDMGANDITTTGKVKFANVYATDGDLPAAGTYHGMFAHVHDGGKAVFAHAGNWVELAKQSDLTTAVNNLVDSAPGALDTLNELAAAMGDDANFSTTMTNNLASKAATGTNMIAGNGLTGGGTLASDRTFNVGGGNGITVSADGIAMSGSYTGDFTATGDVTAYSDESLKRNIQVIDGALGKVENISGYTWNRIADDSRATGVVAQELEAVLPEAVHTDATGLKSVAYGNITGLLIEAVKELSAQVAELKANK
jgi:hypothetical protein